MKLGHKDRGTEGKTREEGHQEVNKEGHKDDDDTKEFVLLH